MVFYESQNKTIEMELRQISTRRISLNFFGSLRCIMDAKYNEFLYVEDFAQASLFPDFVQSWLSTFMVEKESKTLSVIDPLVVSQTAIEDNKLSFLLDALNPKLDKIWECVLFNDFLFERSSLDELYFYLHCRNILFRGPFTLKSKAFFEVITYVKWEQAEFLVDLVMNRYDPHNLNQVKKTLREKAKKKILNKPQMYLDPHFVLRILLEFYRIERKNRLKMLRDTFASFSTLQPNGKFGVNFKNFKKVFEANFPNATDLEVPSSLIPLLDVYSL